MRKESLRMLVDGWLEPIWIEFVWIRWIMKGKIDGLM